MNNSVSYYCAYNMAADCRFFFGLNLVENLERDINTTPRNPDKCYSKSKPYKEKKKSHSRLYK